MDVDRPPDPAGSEPTSESPPPGENGEQRPIMPNDGHGGRQGLAGTCGDPGPHAGDANAMRYDDDASPGSGMPSADEPQRRPNKPDAMRHEHGK